MYYFDIRCDRFSHSGLYKTIEECMQLVEIWEEIYSNVRWNIAPAYRSTTTKIKKYTIKK